ncbi:MAG: methyl-accepting chemotaxis protein [Alphaproteobacteria bacterium]|nr:methyl-accepting chemotaxis protein [Alphaproteobacteria bacterium]
MVGLIVLVGGLSAFAAMKALTDFTRYRQAALSTNKAALVAKAVLYTRLGVKDFVISADPEVIERVRNRLSTALASTREVLASEEDPATRADFEKVATHLQAYGATFDRVTALQDRRDEVVNGTLNVVGRETRERISLIMQSAYEDNDVTAAFRAGVMQQHLLLGRLYALKFLLENDQPSFDRAISELDAADAVWRQLDAELRNSERRALANLVHDGLVTYKRALATVRDIIFERNDLIGNGLDRIGPEVAATMDGLTQRSKATQDHFGPMLQADMGTSRDTVIAIMVAAVAVGIMVAIWLIRLVGRPVISLTAVMEDLTRGNLEVEAAGQDRKDEIGAMARAVGVFRDNAVRVERLQEERKLADERAEAEKRRTMEEVAEKFESSVGTLVEGLTSTVATVKTEAESMTGLLENATTMSSDVASSSEQSNSGIQSVSAAAEELSVTTQEIATQVAQAATMARSASDEADRGDRRIQELSGSIEKIGEVVTLIQDIAEQTNLLALNATIEAARAGEAGKGFAVVASEVKSLANQSAKATDDIRGQIEAVQTAGSEAVAAIQQIGKLIADLDTLNSGVASAVEEQTSTTKEIASSIQEAAQGSHQVSAGITDVAKSAKESFSGAVSVLKRCEDLAKGSGSLEEQVKAFLNQVRVA